MNRTMGWIAAIVITLPIMSGCSSYDGIQALHREATVQDSLPVELQFLIVKNGSPKNFLLLDEADGVKYFASESSDYAEACLAVYPVDTPNQWKVGCSHQIKSDGEIMTVDGAQGESVKLVSTGFATQTLEAKGWKKIHPNILLLGD